MLDRAATVSRQRHLISINSEKITLVLNALGDFPFGNVEVASPWVDNTLDPYVICANRLGKPCRDRAYWQRFGFNHSQNSEVRVSLRFQRPLSGR